MGLDNYIEIVGQKIIIRNLILYWRKRTYLIKEISYISYKDKRTARYYWEGIEVKLRNNKNTEVFWIGAPILNTFEFWKKMKISLEKSSIYAINFREY